MSSSGHRRLATCTYRALLRWSYKAEGVPFQLRHTDVLRCCPSNVFEQLETINTRSDDARLVREIARRSFQVNRGLQDDTEVQEALDRGLEAVQLLHTEYSEMLYRLRSTREVRTDRSRVAFSLGTVFTHKKFGYRGVVYGWDKECERDAAWATAVHADPKQPFYHVLPDEDDCQRIFGAVRLSKYVAQDNVEPVLTPRRINHRAVSHYFDSYSPDLQRYIPNRRLQYEYPDNYDAAIQQNCLQDSNVLEPRMDKNECVSGELERAQECGGEFN